MEYVKHLIVVLFVISISFNYGYSQEENDLVINTEKKGAFNESADIADEVIRGRNSVLL